MAFFERISEHITIMHAEHTTDRPILAVVRGEDKTLLIDAGNSPIHGGLFLSYLKQEGHPLPDYVVLTHWHWDHSFGLPAWQIPVISQCETSEVLRQLAGLDWSIETLRELESKGVINDQSLSDITKEYSDVSDIRVIVPDIMFKERLEINLGGVTCDIEHVGGDHAADSCYVYVREDKTLFLGDALGPSIYGGPRHYTPGKFLTLLTRMKQYEADIFIESHGAPTGKKEFYEDIIRWEQFALFVAQFGDNPGKIAQAMADFLKLDSLPEEFNQAMDYFMAGLRQQRKEGTSNSK
ncbi:Metallo-beta-lactamase superfamily protein [compost metagenome]